MYDALNNDEFNKKYSAFAYACFYIDRVNSQTWSIASFYLMKLFKSSLPCKWTPRAFGLQKHRIKVMKDILSILSYRAAMR